MASRRKNSSARLPGRNKWQQLIIYLFLAAVVFLINYIQRQQTTPAFQPVTEGSWVRLDVIDVDQGDCLLLTSSEGEAMLIDTGSRSQEAKLLDYLQQRQIEKLDYVIATHPHEDHIGSMATIINTFPIGSFYLPDAVSETATFNRMIEALENKEFPVITAEAGLALPWKAGSAQFIAPQSGESYKETNDYSAMLHLQFGETAFLLTGDAEKFSENQALLSGLPIQAQVLKVGHHGSSTSSGEAFLQAVQPQLALISCGRDNSYGHPHTETLEALAKIQAKVYRTDQLGSIAIISDGRELYLASERGD